MTKRSFEAFAEGNGLIVDYCPSCTGYPPTLQVWSNPGTKFNSSGCHVDSSFHSGLLKTSGTSFDWGKCIEHLKIIIAEGVSVCDENECLYCDK